MRSQTIAIVGSGQFESDSFEASLYGQVVTTMQLRGLTVLKNMPNTTRTPHELASNDEFNSRVVTLSKTFRASLGPKAHLIIIASSLGCSIALDTLVEIEKQFPEILVDLVLIGFVADTPIALPKIIRRIDLLVGELDSIQYLEPDGSCSRIIHASEHLKTSQRYLSTNHWVQLKCEIAIGCGHLLEPIENEHSKAMNLITKRLDIHHAC